MNETVHLTAYDLRMAIEANQMASVIGEKAQQLASALGGSANLMNMTPGAASVYLLSLLLSQPELRDRALR